MSPKQWIVLGIAGLAAGGALLLVQGIRQPSAPAAAADIPLGPSVLVAARDIPLGRTVTAEDLVWSAWPETALNESFIQQSIQPDALEKFAGYVARGDLRKGEPVFEGRLVSRGDRGVFAAILTPGYRAVALEVSPATASAGFIQPDDRVDVVVTRSVDRQNGSITVSEPRSGVVLQNIRVLAMGETTRQQDAEESGPKPITASVATLELLPRDAEILMTAVKIGDVSLLLRGLEAPGSRSGATSANPFAAEMTLQSPVRIHAFGSTTDDNVPRMQP